MSAAASAIPLDIIPSVSLEALLGKRDADYKTNRPQMFGRKAIVSHVVDSFGFACQTTCSSLDDLMRAFCLLDGQPEPDHRQGAFRSLSKGMSREPRSWETPYFQVRTFKNGNGHEPAR